jgi:uncharacterized protein YraI
VFTFKWEEAMKKSIRLALVCILLLVLPSISATTSSGDNPAVTLYRIEVHNRTGQSVSLSLVGSDVPSVYYLSVAAGTTGSYTIRGGIYNQTTHACGAAATGTLQVTQQLRLVFTPCSGNAPNSGAPTIEKIHLTDAPHGSAWFYQFNPTPMPSSSSLPVVSTAGACQITALNEVTIYNRPSTAADVFSTQPAGFNIKFSARTSGGWLGFDPGVAQAANIGSFRLRWVAPGTQTISGGCSRLPVVWGPPPGVCFDMPMEDVNVHATADTSSPVVIRLNVGDFAAITGQTADGNWVKVDLGPGNTGSSATGWVESSTINVNGPCSSLPTVTP